MQFLKHFKVLSQNLFQCLIILLFFCSFHEINYLNILEILLLYFLLDSMQSLKISHLEFDRYTYSWFEYRHSMIPIEANINVHSCISISLYSFTALPFWQSHNLYYRSWILIRLISWLRIVREIGIIFFKTQDKA